MRASLFLLICIFIVACNEAEEEGIGKVIVNDLPRIATPSFNQDSAYIYISEQVEIGPRVPNSPEQDSCAKYLISKLRSFNLEVTTQEGQVTGYDGMKLRFINIIASSNPESHKRILLCAHWDTRPIADRDVSRRNEPIPGANDGASGVGVLLEIGRLLGSTPPNIGVDIVLFDVEDYGRPSVNNSYCLGSQYWSKAALAKGYYPKYGILLDMVGAKDAQFYMEGYSRRYAPHVVKKVWEIAANLGYSNHFIFKQIPPITDDHLYVNTLANIPCINIIQHDPLTPTNFGSYWHTHNDNMDIIDKGTLKAVGQTILEVVYTEK
ncbi:MAG: glutamine cyclotransferase [Bacteroidetes bacterium]|nr:MAG: glutamine cyclotransferase [Bacteroidota bacterium]